ncbi:MAG: endolytic transglycosylase MltG [Lachnospiraceae bacterium]|nr:endolytic transglycosylase MltG [Lachnospiraceae bacterium]
MKANQIIGATIELVVKVVVFVAIVMFIVNASVRAYDYGYRVFAEEPVSVGEGRTISVIVEDGDSVKDIGEMLQEKGLIRDANLFVVQELLSEQHGKIQPGIYDLNTSMTSEEMLAVMAAVDGTEEDSSGQSE